MNLSGFHLDNFKLPYDFCIHILLTLSHISMDDISIRGE